MRKHLYNRPLPSLTSSITSWSRHISHVTVTPAASSAVLDAHHIYKSPFPPLTNLLIYCLFIFVRIIANYSRLSRTPLHVTPSYRTPFEPSSHPLCTRSLLNTFSIFFNPKLLMKSLLPSHHTLIIQKLSKHLSLLVKDMFNTLLITIIYGIFNCASGC